MDVRRLVVQHIEGLLLTLPLTPGHKTDYGGEDQHQNKQTYDEDRFVGCWRRNKGCCHDSQGNMAQDNLPVLDDAVTLSADHNRGLVELGLVAFGAPAEEVITTCRKTASAKVK